MKIYRRGMIKVPSMPDVCSAKNGYSCDYNLEYWHFPHKCKKENKCTKNTMFILKSFYDSKEETCFHCKYEKESFSFHLCYTCKHGIMCHDLLPSNINPEKLKSNWELKK